MGATYVSLFSNQFRLTSTISFKHLPNRLYLFANPHLVCAIYQNYFYKVVFR